MTGEKLFENKVKRFLDTRHAWYYKVFSGGYQRAGIPDIIGVCNGWFFAIEVKAEKGRPSELQKYEIRKIQEAGGYAIILYPKDFDRFKEDFDAYFTSDAERTGGHADAANEDGRREGSKPEVRR